MRAIAPAGIVLSQPTRHTRASNMCPRPTSSMESAITSRLMSEVFIPSVPIVTPSEMAMVLSSIGVPPASRTPSLTRSARRRWLKLHGIVSIQVCATPTMGLLRSSSSKPMALSIDRAPALSRPSRMVRLLRRVSVCIAYLRPPCCPYSSRLSIESGIALRQRGSEASRRFCLEAADEALELRRADDGGAPGDGLLGLCVRGHQRQLEDYGPGEVALNRFLVASAVVAG